ncbi:hypothetical protein C8R43DRAFT_514815 [Mycena crocata]|nr:hypothetical protein C8R43DRAFT_514815 [Mycena crocata]
MDLTAPVVRVKEPLSLSDADKKRKIRAMQRAKGNHLLRQLQLRLQYAKLKVDHGWQKQHLNEVENLWHRERRTSDVNIDPQLLLDQPRPDETGGGSSWSFALGSPQPPDASGLHVMDEIPVSSTGPWLRYDNGRGSGRAPYPVPQAGSSVAPPPYPTDPSNLQSQSAKGETSFPAPTNPSSSSAGSSESSSSNLPLPIPLPESYGSFWSTSGMESDPVPEFNPVPLFDSRGEKGNRKVSDGVTKRSSRHPQGDV